MARIRLVECGEKGSLVKAGGLAVSQKRGVAVRRDEGILTN
jgi:hypothetical protein